MERFWNQVEEIRRFDKKRVPGLRSGMLAGHMCRVLSPICTAWFIKKDICPNKVTLLMILFGVMGSVFFAIPNVWFKVVGYIFFFFWFTMDLSDGEVAFFTKQFSKYGTEMDYMAHLIDHPCMNIALFLTFYQIYPENLLFISIIFVVFISIELITRSVIAFDHYWTKIDDIKTGNIKVSYLKYFLSQLLLYPNFILLFSPLVIVDYVLHVNIIYLLLVYVIMLFVSSIRELYKRLLRYYKS